MTNLILFDNGAKLEELPIEIVETSLSYDLVLQLIADGLKNENTSKWAIGDVLVMARLVSGKSFLWSIKADQARLTGEPFPFEVVETLKKRHSGIEPIRKYPALSWEVIEYENYWLIDMGNQFRMWRVDTVRPEDTMKDYAFQISQDLNGLVDDKTLMHRYRTSFCFPVKYRREYISWTAHFEVANLVGTQLGNPRDQVLKIEAANNRLAEYEETGRLRVSDIRSDQRRLSEEMRGYIFSVPLPDRLLVVDPNTQTEFTAISFSANNIENCPEIATVVKYALCFAGIIKTWPKEELPKITMMQSGLLTLDGGENIGRIENETEPAVEKALSYLAEKMDWQIKYD